MIEQLNNVVPNEIALKIRQAFIDADYDEVIQKRRKKYTLEKDEKFQATPDPQEVFSAHYHRSRYLENSALIKKVYEEYILPVIIQRTNCVFLHHDLRCYKMTSGGHFRIHKDDYQSSFGFIWYLSKDWKWDWGGLLITVNEGLSANVYIPQFNNLVIIDHQEGQIPHFVSEVAIHALEPRLMLVGFLQ